MILKNIWIRKEVNFQKQMNFLHTMLYRIFQTLRVIPPLEIYLLLNGCKN